MTDSSTSRSLWKISAAEIALAIWRRKWIVAAAAILGLLFAIFQIHRSVPTYAVTLKVTSVALEQTSGQLSNGRLGSLASLAGIGLPTSANGISFDLYLDALKGRDAADALAANPQLMQRMFAGEWDATSKSWRPPRRSIFHAVSAAIKSVFGMREVQWQPPNGAQVEAYVDGMVTVTKTPYTPVVTLEMQSADPEFGKQFLWSLHLAVDDSLRQKTLLRENRYIDYLKHQLEGVTISDYRASLVSTLTDQEKQRMVASSGLSYAADPVEQVTVSSAPTEPRQTRILATDLALFTAVGTACAFLLGWFNLTLFGATKLIYGAITSRSRRDAYAHGELAPGERR